MRVPLPQPCAANHRDFCRDGDPVCQANAFNILAHLFYFLDAPAAGTYVAARA